MNSIEGYSSRNAILKGLKVSGSSITYAGLIMATTGIDFYTNMF